MQNENNKLDDLLKRKFSGNSSPLPEGMLGRILDEQKRKKRVVFWWMNAAFLCAIAIVAFVVFQRYILDDVEKTDVAKTEKTKIENNKAHTNQPNLPQTKTNADSNAVPVVSENANIIHPELTTVAKSQPTQTHNNKPSEEVKKPQEPTITENIETKPNEANRKDSTIKIAANVGEKVIEKPKVKPVETPIVKDKPTADSKEVKVAKNTPKEIDSTANDAAFVPHHKKDKPKYKWYPEGYIGLGWFQENQLLKMAEQDLNYVLRDYSSVAKSSIQPLTGSVFSAGIQGKIRPNIRLQGGIQLAQASNNFKYSYKLMDKPTYDTSGRINGYSTLPDSSQRQITQNHSYLVPSLAIPIQIGYCVPLGKSFELCGFVGVAPQWRFKSYWMMPNKKDIEKMEEIKVPAKFTMPVTLGLGIYRKEENYTFGLQGRIAPVLSNPMHIAQGLDVQYRRTEISFVVGFKLGR